MTPKILIVDDSSLARRTLRKSLEGLGYSAEEAADGIQALERFSVSPPALVLLDLVMSGMYGLEVLSKLRKLDPDVRVIVATADVQKATVAEVQAAGAKGILNKPVDAERLKLAVKTVMNGGETWT